MLKKISILLIIFVMVFCSFYKPSMVKAEEDKTFVIELPSNEVDYYTLNIHFQHFSDLILFEDVLSEYSRGDEDRIINNGEKDVLKLIYKNEMTRFEYYEGVTENDCIFEITEEMRSEIVEDLGFDPYENYSKVQLVLKEFEIVEKSQGDTIFIDLKYDRTVDMSYIDFDYLGVIMNKRFTYLNQESGREYVNLDGKLIMKKINDAHDDILEWGDVSSEDDIEYTLEEEDYNYILYEFGSDVSGYEKMVLAFGDYEYDSSYYVVDFEMNENLWNFFAEKGLVKNSFEYNQYFDSDGKELFKIINGLDIIKQQNLTYEDTLVFDISEDEAFLNYLEEKFDIVGVNRIVLKFKDPEFIEGDNQEYNSEKDEGLTFRLNIPFDKFEESGEVYLDDELVDSKNYTATEGSTIITFKKDYLKGLDSGEHTLQVNVSDGTATATFNIVDGESSSKDPETGDSLFLYLGLILLSITGIYSVKQRLV